MAVPFIKAYYTPPGGTEEDITSLLNFSASRGLELKSGKVDITLNNSRFRDKTGGESIFQEDGAFDIYVDYSPITKASNQLVLSGKIRKLKFDSGETGSKLTITVADRTTLLLSGLWSKDYSGLKPDEIIKSVINQVSRGEISTTNVATTNKDGDAFDVLDNFTFNTFKPVYEWISEISQTEYTGDDRAYVFYVDKDNDLHWFYPSQTAGATLEESIDDVFSFSFERNNDDVVNMVIFNAGSDLNGNGVLWYYHDTTSRSNQLHMKYQPMTDVSQEVFDQEILVGNLVEDTSGTIPYKGKLYSKKAGFTAWSFGGTDNDAWRTELKTRGTAKAKKITAAFGKLLWNGRIELRGTNSFVAGDLIMCNFPSAGIIYKKLRVHDLTQHVGKGGWITSIELKEDEDAITDS